MKKTINYVMLLALLVMLVPVHALAAPAAAGAPNFFIPDNTSLGKTANMVIVSTDPTSLDRTNAMVTNAGTLPIAGTFQQVQGNSISLTVEQFAFDSATTKWGPVSGKTFNSPVTAQGSRFNVTGVQLFSGFNRITFTGLQSGVTKKDIFYVLYDTAPLLNSLQVTSNNQTYAFNEGVSLVVTGTTAAIQGNVSNAKTVQVNNQKATLLGNGLFYAPPATLTPGLNNFDIQISNDTDTITMKRQLYYYDPTHPFTIADAKIADSTITPSPGYETEHLVGATPTFTSDGNTFALQLQFLIPDTGTAFGTTGTLTVNSTTPVSYSNSGESVITNTYGQTSYRLVTINTTTPIPLLPNGPGYAVNQPVNISMTTSIPATPTLAQNFGFNLAFGQNMVKDIKLLPNYPGGTASVDATTNMVPLDGSQVMSPSFWVLVETTKPLTPSSSSNILDVNLLPLGTTTLTAQDNAVKYQINSTTTDPNKLVFKISGLPQGAQKLSFNVRNNTAAFTANVNYVSKNYVSIDNLYDGQLISFNGSGNVSLSGKFIGFGNNLMTGSQLIVNNTDQSSHLHLGSMNPADGSYDFIYASTPSSTTSVPLAVNRTTGPLYFGENDIKFIVNYSTVASGTTVLRQYIKEIKVYIVDSNVPDFANLLPLTPPASGSGGNLASSTPSTYLPPSPEFQFSPGFYTTTISSMDLFVEGSGAAKIAIQDGQNLIFGADFPTGAATTTPTVTSPASTAFTSYDFYGNTSSFKLRLNKVALSTIGTRTFTVVLTNTNGATATKTLEIHRDNVPFTLLSPAVNMGNEIIVNKNFVLFDVDAAGATEVQINGAQSTKRTDFPGSNRFVYTFVGLKADADNKIKLTVKRPAGDLTRTINVKYVADPNVGSMYMEQMGTKHTAFNKGLQLTFPKNTALRRVNDGKLQPDVNLLFGIANPNDGNTELVNDYGQSVGTSFDSRTSNGASVVLINQPLLANFTSQLGRTNFTRVSPYYWVSAGLGEQGTVGSGGYLPATGGLSPYSVEGTFTNYPSGTSRQMAITQRGSITLHFDGDVVDQAGQETTVFFLGNDNKWKNLGGFVDVKNHTITVPFDDFGYYMAGKLRYSFDDIVGHGWARDIMQASFAKGYMPQGHATTFGSGDYVKREEFITTLVRALGLKLNYDSNATFPVDVSYNSSGPYDIWNYYQIETAARAGIVQGIQDGVFGAGQDLTRQDAAVMIARALDMKLATNDAKLDAKLGKAFADGVGIDRYARPAVDALNASGIMVGSPVSSTGGNGKPAVNFNPTANLTRAEEAQIVVRLLQKFLKTFPTNLS